MSEQEQENHLAKLVLEARSAQKKLACLTSKARQTGDILYVVMDALKNPIGIDFGFVRKQYLEVADTDIGNLIAEMESTLDKLVVLDREIKAIEHPSRPAT